MVGNRLCRHVGRLRNGLHCRPRRHPDSTHDPLPRCVVVFVLPPQYDQSPIWAGLFLDVSPFPSLSKSFDPAASTTVFDVANVLLGLSSTLGDSLVTSQIRLRNVPFCLSVGVCCEPRSRVADPLLKTRRGQLDCRNPSPVTAACKPSKPWKVSKGTKVIAEFCSVRRSRSFATVTKSLKPSCPRCSNISPLTPDDDNPGQRDHDDTEHGSRIQTFREQHDAP